MNISSLRNMFLKDDKINLLSVHVYFSEIKKDHSGC